MAKSIISCVRPYNLRIHFNSWTWTLANLDDRIKNPDQLGCFHLIISWIWYTPFRMITHDIQRFSMHLAAIYSNLAKPVLDVILYNYQLSQNVGAEGLLILTVLVQTTAIMCEFLPSMIVTARQYRPESAPLDTTFWDVYRSIGSALWLSPSHTFTHCRVRRRNRVPRWWTDREDVIREGICQCNQAWKPCIETSMVVWLCWRRCDQMALGKFWGKILFFR